MAAEDEDKKIENQEEENQEDQVPEVKFTEIRKDFIDGLNDGNIKYIDLQEQVSVQKIDGQTMDYWEDFFKINIGESPNSTEVYASLSKLNSLISFANSKESKAELAEIVAKRELDHARAKRFIALKELKSKKRITDKYIESRLDSDLHVVEFKFRLAEYVKNFWHKKNMQLISTRKILESISFSMASERKIFNNPSAAFDDANFLDDSS